MVVVSKTGGENVRGVKCPWGEISDARQLAVAVNRRRRRRGISGVTRNSGGHGQISKSSPPSPFPIISPFRPSLLLTLCPPSHPSLALYVLPFPSLPSSHSLLSLPSLPPPLYSQPFSFPSLPPLLLITARESGERYSSPAGQGGARPPKAFCAIRSPKSANLLKVSPTCTIRPVGSVAIKHSVSDIQMSQFSL